MILIRELGQAGTVIAGWLTHVPWTIYRGTTRKGTTYVERLFFTVFIRIAATALEFNFYGRTD